MFKFILDIDDYEDRKVARSVVGGYIVSTALTSDEGYETAICAADGAHPVERYANRQSAEIGHSVWIKRMESPPVKILALGGLYGMVKNKTIILKPVDAETLMRNSL